METTNVAVRDNKERRKGKRGSAAPNDQRKVQKEFEKLVSIFPFIEKAAGRLSKSIHQSSQSQRIKNAVDAETLEWMRVTIARMFNGAVEESFRLLTVKALDGSVIEDNVRTKERLGTIWHHNKRYYFTPQQTAELKEATTRETA
jgi:hypothetical protein